jgi:prepilin-type processing-associated H-X9-DG protein
VNEGNRNSMYKKGVLWQCPTWKGRVLASIYQNNDKTGYGRNPLLNRATASGYTGDDFFDMASSIGQPWCHYVVYRFTTLDFPSNNIIAGDSDDWGLNPGNAPAGTFPTPTYAGAGVWNDARRHRGAANYLFGDCHVANQNLVAAWWGLTDPSKKP